jgi:hypothetical protein
MHLCMEKIKNKIYTMPKQKGGMDAPSRQDIANANTIGAQWIFNAQKENSDMKVKDMKVFLLADLDRSIEDLKKKREQLNSENDETPWSTYVNKEISALSSYGEGKSAKALVVAIGSYNFLDRNTQLQKGLKFMQDRTKYTCGTMSCKERGFKIKQALTDLLTYSPDALASLGINSNMSNAYGYWLGKPSAPVATNATPVANNQNATPVANNQNAPAVDANKNQNATPANKNPADTKKWWSWGGKRTRRRRHSNRRS